MCSQCGDIYDQEGYKVVQIPMPGASPAPTTFEVKKEEHPTVTQEPATAETQEPTADIIPEIKESHAHGAITLFSLHQIVETQESTIDFVASPQEPSTEVVTVTQKPISPLDTPMTDQ